MDQSKTTCFYFLSLFQSVVGELPCSVKKKSDEMTQSVTYPPPMMTTHVVSSVSGRSALSSDDPAPALDDWTLDDVMISFLMLMPLLLLPLGSSQLR
jgi:hypothetical protein